jgi:hypothetical protein
MGRGNSMEACGSAHFLGSALLEEGHDVRLSLFAKPVRHRSLSSRGEASVSYRNG